MRNSLGLLIIFVAVILASLLGLKLPSILAGGQKTTVTPASEPDEPNPDRAFVLARIRSSQAGAVLGADRFVMGYGTENEPGLPGSIDTILREADRLSAVAMFWFRLAPDKSGNVELTPGASADQIRAETAAAKAKGVPVFALVHNLLYGSSREGREIGHSVLTDPGRRDVFVESLLGAIDEYGLSGVNVDIENLYPTDGPAYVQMLAALKPELAARGALLTVSVPAKTYGDGSNPWSAPFDYRQISLYADYVAVMTYDEHGYSTGPGPIASVPWMNSVIQYAVDQMPRAKILLGIPAYGFDWGDSGAPTYLSYPRAMASLATSGAVLVRDPASDVPHFTYVKNGQRHEVWFEDARSWAKKLDLVEDYDLGGVAIWRLGMEDPASWRLFPEK